MFTVMDYLAWANFKSTEVAFYSLKKAWQQMLSSGRRKKSPDISYYTDCVQKP